VLLGDVVDLRQAPLRGALRDAEKVLGAIGAALGPGREVLIVPGNHDHHLLGPWLERRAQARAPSRLGLEAAVDWHADDILAGIAEPLAPASVRAAYPGAWLRHDVYATHGHYLDRHTTVPSFERLAAGAMARIVRDSAGEPRPEQGEGYEAESYEAEDYEAVLAPIYAWAYALAQTGGDFPRDSQGASGAAWRALTGTRTGARPRRRARVEALRASVARHGLRRRAMIAAFPVAIAAGNRAGLGPLRAEISADELRRAALRALGEVLVRLGVDARYVIFGHTHRAGPLAGENDAEWTAPTGARLLNTGCWIHEPVFAGDDPSRGPYRPGFAAVIEAEGPPVLTNLLESVTLCSG